MKNIANRKPPEFFRFGENIYSIYYDFQVWIDVIDLLDELDFENLEEDVDILEKIETLVFGTPIDENIWEVLKKITGFATGYPQHRNKGVEASKPQRRLFDFKIDMNSIIIAIRDQSGIDLSKRKEPFHWWLFLLEFYNLTPEHHICKLMELRAYDGDDKEMRQARDAVALPAKISKRQKRFEDEMDKIFYNC